MPYGPANNNDGLSGTFSDLGRTASINGSAPTALSIQLMRLTHVGQPISGNFSPRTRSTESSVPPSFRTGPCRLPTDVSKYDHPRRIQPPVSGQRKTNFQVVAQVMPVDTR